MRPRRIALSFAAVSLIVGGTAGAAELGGFIDVGLRADYLTSIEGDAETFVFATSTSSYQLSVVDTTLNEDIGPFDYLADANTRARGIAASPDGSDLPIAAVVSNDGYVDFFLVEELEIASQTGAGPTPDFFEADLDNEPLAGLAIDALGTRTYTGVPADDTVAINTISTGTLASTILLGHTPVATHAVNTGVIERVFLGCDDGFLAWVDTSTLTPSAVAIGAATDRMGVMATADYGGGGIRLLLLNETDDTLYVIDPGAPGTPLDSAAIGANVVAIAASGSGTSLRIWLAIDDATNGHRVEVLDSTLAEVQADIALPAAPRSITTRDARVYVGLTDTRLAVIGDLPFVEITAATPDPIPLASTAVTVQFLSSQSGTAKVFLNGDELESIAVTADVAASVTLAAGDVSGLLDEGRNRIRVEVAAASGTGSDEEVIVFDEAPDAPRNFEVGFGDERVIGRWDPPAGANDVDYYLVYFGLSATDTSGTATQTSPAEVNGGEYVVDVPNGTEVFLSVAAVDSGGNMSARTSTKSATAQPTAGAAELAGDEGGFMCAVAGLERRSAPIAVAILLGLCAIVISRARMKGSATGGRRPTEREKDLS